MARNRMIQLTFWGDEKLSHISRDARLTFIGMWNNADDYGVVKGHPAWLKNNIYPYDDIKLSEFEKWIAELESIGVIIPFCGNGEKFYLIKNFLRHQTINRPSQTRNPSPPDNITEGSLSPPDNITEHSWSTHGVLTSQIKLNRKEIKLKEKEREVVMMVSAFDKFFSVYPKKKSRGQAEKAFLKINPDEQLLDLMLSMIERAKTSEEWIKEKGKYIPYPATWLNAKGWLDEETESHPLADVVSDTTLRNISVFEKWRPPA